MSFLQHFEATCPKLYILSSPCHFQCENLPTCPDVQLPLDSRGGKNIPRDLVTRNFLNLNEFWEFVKMCETSPKVNNGKFLKALVSQHTDTGHTWQKRQLTKSLRNKRQTEGMKIVCVVLEQTTNTNKTKTTTRAFKANSLGKQRRTIVVKWNAEEKRLENRGGRSKACFSLGGRVLTIGC